MVRDRPGILAHIATALAGQGVNLDAVLQEPGYPRTRCHSSSRSSRARKSALERALETIAVAEWHAEAPLALPMLV